MSKYFLSIVIPVFNAAAYLPLCLERIISSGLNDMEILLVDDGSTDGSTEICRDYSEKYEYIQHIRQANSGPAAARNRGMDESRGEYITFADSDDLIEPELFAESISLLRKHDADLWAADFHRVSDNGCILDRVYQIEDSGAPIIGREYLKDFLSAKDCVWNVWRYVFKRKFLKKNALRFSEGYSIAEDLEFAVKALSLCERPGFYHAPYYNYRVNYGDTLTRKYSAERARQFVTMLLSAAENCGSGIEATLIKEKLAREYILNLSLYWEAPERERAGVLEAFNKGRALMGGAAGIYRHAAGFIKLCGIPFSSALLLAMKKGKRLARQIKSKRHGGE